MVKLRRVSFLLLILATVAATRGDVVLPTTDQAECGVSKTTGLPACDFEFYLKEQGGNGEPSRPNEQSGQPAGYVNRGGGYCLTTEKNGKDAFSLCGGSASQSGGGATLVTAAGGGASTDRQAAESFAWGVARGIIAYRNFMPGVFEDARGQKAQAAMDANLAAFTRYSDFFAHTSSALVAAQGSYLAKVVVPAADAVRRQSIEQLGQDLAATVAEFPKGSATTVAPSPRTEKYADTSDAVRASLEAAQNKSDRPRALWEELEAHWDVHDIGVTADLSPDDAESLREAHARYFNRQSLLNERATGAETAKISDGMTSHLQTNARSPFGHEIRRQLNRGLVAYASATSEPVRQQQALGGMALIVGADEAYAQGHASDAIALRNMGAIALDITLGLTPGVGAANDAVQLVFGMLTGRDYTGHAMTKADYALRGAGVMLGIVGAKAVLQIGGKVIGTLFESGARAIRASGLGERFALALGKAPEAAVDVGEAAGTLVPHVPTTVSGGIDAAESLTELETTLRGFPGAESRVAKEITNLPVVRETPFPQFLKKFNKHVLNEKDIVVTGPFEYVREAREIARGGEGVKAYVRSDGAIFYYRQSTRQLVIVQKGKISTYFRPDGGLEYVLKNTK